jgi:protein disulfide-isomerase
MMRFLPFFIALLFITPNLIAQETQDSAYVATMDGWLVNIDEAYQISKKEGKPIMANFTGSDWCGWCIRLKKDVFETAEFKKWAAENVVLLELDFPRRFKLPENIQQQNNSLAQAMGVSAYPTIWVFDLVVNEKGNQINPVAKSGYVKGGPEAWIADLEGKMK